MKGERWAFICSNMLHRYAHCFYNQKAMENFQHNLLYSALLIQCIVMEGCGLMIMHGEVEGRNKWWVSMTVEGWSHGSVHLSQRSSIKPMMVWTQDTIHRED